MARVGLFGSVCDLKRSHVSWGRGIGRATTRSRRSPAARRAGPPPRAFSVASRRAAPPRLPWRLRRRASSAVQARAVDGGRPRAWPNGLAEPWQRGCPSRHPSHVRISSRCGDNAPNAAQPPGIALHRPRRLHPEDCAVEYGIPVTSISRTLLDLAEIVQRRRLRHALEESERLGKFDLRGARAADRPQQGTGGSGA